MAGASITHDQFNGTDSGDANGDQIRKLSSLRSFMPKWELNQKTQLGPLAKKIKNNITKKLKTEVSKKKINSNLDIMIVSDLGSPKRRDKILKELKNKKVPYSRLIIGGTTDEFDMGIVTGLATHVDVGNFDLTDTAIVLLDLLSGPSRSSSSINGISLAKGAKKINLVADLIANVASHEIGHILGNWHTDNTNDTPSIMDQGNKIAQFVGVLEGDSYGDKTNLQISWLYSTI